MSSENSVADRLLSEARKKTARTESPKLGKAALIVGVVAVVVSPVSILGWLVGATALGMGYSASQRSVSRTRGRIAMVLGFVAHPDRRLLLHADHRVAPLTGCPSGPRSATRHDRGPRSATSALLEGLLHALRPWPSADPCGRA